MRQTESLFIGGINDGKSIPVDEDFCTVQITVGNDKTGIIRKDYYVRNGDSFILSHQEVLH